MAETYIDGFVIPVSTAKRDAYLGLAKMAAQVFKDHGALQVVECWGDDVPEGKLTSFAMAVKLEADETVVFSWIVWPDKATRMAGMKAAMEDVRMQPGAALPFDGKRMIFGGFRPILEA